MKKVLSILLAVCLVVAAVPTFLVSAKSENIVKNGDFSGLSEGTIESNWADFNNECWYGGGVIAKDPGDDSNLGCIVGYNLYHKLPALKSNTTYQLSYNYRRAADAPGTGTNLRIRVLENNDSSKIVANSFVNGKDGDYLWCSPTQWQNQMATFKTGDLSAESFYSLYFSVYGSGDLDKVLLLDNVSLTEVVEPTNSGLIMDGDFEATEQLTAYSKGIINNLTNGKWYASSTGAVSVKSDEEHGNYAVLSANKAGRLVQNLPAAKLDESVVITFKARSTNASKLMYFYVVPSAAFEGFGGRVCRNIATEWTEYTMIFNPMGTEADSNVQIDPLGSGNYSGQNVIFEIYNPAGNGCDLEIDDIRIEKADPFASNDLGLADLTGVSMRGADGSLPTAIRWKNAITKTFAANGVGDFNKVIEYGALVANTSTLEANNEKLTENANSAKIKGVAYNDATKKLFAETEKYNIFSLALSGITTENYGKDLTVRPYVKISNGQKTITVYGESRYNSLFDACHAVLSGNNETDIALVKGILTETDDVKQAYLDAYPADSGKLQ